MYVEFLEILCAINCNVNKKNSTIQEIPFTFDHLMRTNFNLICSEKNIYLELGSIIESTTRKTIQIIVYELWAGLALTRCCDKCTFFLCSSSAPHQSVRKLLWIIIWAWVMVLLLLLWFIVTVFSIRAFSVISWMVYYTI